MHRVACSGAHRSVHRGACSDIHRSAHWGEGGLHIGAGIGCVKGCNVEEHMGGASGCM